MNVREFRKDLSKHFDDVLQGKKVYVTRGDRVFLLSVTELETLTKPENVTKSVYTKIPANREVYTPKPRGNTRVHTSVVDRCKHGAFPELCKHAKVVNGEKVCK